MATNDGGAGPADPLHEAAGGGTLVIRTWFDSGHQSGFRARITYGQASGAEQTVAAADPDQVLGVVQEWLAAQHPDRGSN